MNYELIIITFRCECEGARKRAHVFDPRKFRDWIAFKSNEIINQVICWTWAWRQTIHHTVRRVMAFDKLWIERTNWLCVRSAHRGSAAGNTKPISKHTIHWIWICWFVPHSHSQWNVCTDTTHGITHFSSDKAPKHQQLTHQQQQRFYLIILRRLSNLMIWFWHSMNGVKWQILSLHLREVCIWRRVCETNAFDSVLMNFISGLFFVHDFTRSQF